MRLRYTKPDGTHGELIVGARPITIGRNPDSDIQLIDDRVSRIHCGLRQWEGAYQLKDLKSRNGTFVNGERVDTVNLNPGDQIRIGQQILVFEDENAPGPNTTIREINKQMAGGKGYTTILREIAPETAAKPVVPPMPEDEPEPPPSTPPTGARKPSRIVIKKRPAAE